MFSKWEMPVSGRSLRDPVAKVHLVRHDGMGVIFQRRIVSPCQSDHAESLTVIFS